MTDAASVEASEVLGRVLPPSSSSSTQNASAALGDVLRSASAPRGDVPRFASVPPWRLPFDSARWRAELFVRLFRIPRGAVFPPLGTVLQERRQADKRVVANENGGHQSTCGMLFIGTGADRAQLMTGQTAGQQVLKGHPQEKFWRVYTEFVLEGEDAMIKVRN